MKCANCGEPIEFYRPSGKLKKNHPYRAEFKADGGWWLHSTGQKRYLRSCAFAANLAESQELYAKFGTAKATPAPSEVPAPVEV